MSFLYQGIPEVVLTPVEVLRQNGFDVTYVEGKILINYVQVNFAVEIDKCMHGNHM